MNFNGLRWPVVIAVILITFGLLLAGMKLYQLQSVDRPLFKLYQDVKEVKDVQIKKLGDETIVLVYLNRVDNLQSTYGRIHELARGVLERNKFRVELIDNRTPLLEQVYYRIQYSLQEANANGNFTDMAREIEAQQKMFALDDSRVYVDGDNLYVALYHRGAYLYEVIPRGRS